MNIQNIEKWIRHYDTLLWTVSSILTAANVLLISALVQVICCKTSLFEIEILISTIGLSLTIATVYFAISFRKLRHGFMDQYNKDAKEEDKKNIQKIRKAAPEQWGIYVFIFWLIGLFWVDWSIFTYQKYEQLICYIAFSVVVTICFFVLHEIGKYKELDLK
jgi:mannose/fructose/N-acetylgalactosamine-specific phosphotransferase system component IIC